MKRIMVSSLIVIIVLAVTLVFTSFKNNGEESSNFIVVRTIESANHGGVFQSKILVLDGSKTIRTGELEVNRAKNIEANSTQIYAVLASVKSQGYTLVSSNSAPCGGDIQAIISNYIFEKK